MQRSWVVPVVVLAAVLLAVAAAVGLLGNDASSDVSRSAGGPPPPSPAGAAEHRTDAPSPVVHPPRSRRLGIDFGSSPGPGVRAGLPAAESDMGPP